MAKKDFCHKLNADDEVYIYFPRHSSGQSPNEETSGENLLKCPEDTYKVSSGQTEHPQAIHVDRMRA